MPIIDLARTFFSYTYNHPKFGFFLWFFIGILVLFFYTPFQQPLMFDRAFLVYMAQVVSRGDPLYQATPFGYTPLSTLVVGGLMWVGGLFSLTTIEVARVVGILFYGLSSGFVFLMIRSLFKDMISPFLGAILFCGIAFLPIMASVNAEPKIWVLLCSIAGIHSFARKQWLWCGLIFSASAMSWHVSVISVAASGIAILVTVKQKQIPVLLRFSAGVLLSVLPVLLYLHFTDGWAPFWEQAIVRKLAVEGKSVGTTPLFWMLRGSYPLLSDALHLLFAIVGFVLAVHFRFFERNIAKSPFRDQAAVDIVLIYTLLWALFNSIEFDGITDLISFVPMIIVYAVVSIGRLRILHGAKGVVLWILLVGYGLFETAFYDLPFTYQDQVATISKLKEKYGRPFVIGFEAYYTVLERPMPTKFMRYWPYEDFLINRQEGGCQGIKEWLQEGEYTHILEFRQDRRSRSESAQKALDFLGLEWEGNETRGKCARFILKKLTNQQEIDQFIIKTQLLPIGGDFYTNEYFSVYRIESAPR